MTNVKCIRCGALNIGTAQVCKVCEIELNPVRPPLARSVPFPTLQSAAEGENRNTRSPTIGPFKEVSDVLGPTLSLFTKNFWLITKIVVVIVAPFEIFKTLNTQNIENNWQLAGGIFVLDVMCRVLIAPALIYALMTVMQTGTAPGVNESYRWGFSKLGKLAVCAALAWILQALGFALCIIPGIIIGLSLQLVYPIAVLEKGSPSEVLQSSRELTKGHRWNILGASIVIWLLLMIITLPAQAFATNFAVGDGVFWPLHVAAATFADIIEQVTTVFSLVTYLSIRALWSQRTQ